MAAIKISSPSSWTIIHKTLSPDGQRAARQAIANTIASSFIAVVTFIIDYTASRSPLWFAICTAGMGFLRLSHAWVNKMSLAIFLIMWILQMGISYGIARLSLVDCHFTIYMNIGFCTDLLGWCWQWYVALDGPSQALEEKGAQLLDSFAVRVIVLVGLHGGRPLIWYLTRNLRDYDKPSAAMFMGTLGAFLLWTRLGRSHVVPTLLNVSNFVQFYDWKLHQAVAWIRHWVKWKAIEYAEARQIKQMKVDKMKPFTYSPLDPGQIRLLRQPRRPIFSLPGLIELEMIALDRHDYMHMTTVTDSRGYEAISYTWGPREPARDIILNGRRFKVAPNLYALLHARRSIVRDRIMWIDAICINQEDKTEQAEQVRAMNHIYADASRVVSWLGDKYDAGLGVHRLFKIWENSHILSERPIEPFLSYYRMLDRADLHAFFRLFRDDYFFRGWIFQEVVLGKDVQFYVAGKYITWAIMSEVVNLMARPEFQSLMALTALTLADADAYQTGTRAMRTHENLRQMAMLKSLRSIVDVAIIPPALLLSMTYGLQTTVPADKVFCLLGLTNSPEARAIRVDYESSTREVLEQVASVLLESTENAGLTLAFAGIWNLCDEKETRSRWQEDLPSWVPDWECVGHCHRTQLTSPYACVSNMMMAQSSLTKQSLKGLSSPELLQVARNLGNLSYCASRGSDRTAFQITTEHVSYSEQQVKLLSTYTLFVDSIEDMTRPLHIDKQDLDYLPMGGPRERKWLHEVQELVEATLPHEDPITGTLREETLWRTLVADRTEYERPAPDEYGRFFHVYRQVCLRGWTYTTIQNNQTELMKLLNPEYRPELDPHNMQPLLAIIDAIRLFRLQIQQSAATRRFAVTKRLRTTALVPPGTKKGDVVCLMPGIETPMLLRSVVDGALSGNQEPDASSRYRLVGECYVYGIMDGEAMEGGEWPVVSLL